MSQGIDRNRNVVLERLSKKSGREIIKRAAKTAGLAHYDTAVKIFEADVSRCCRVHNRTANGALLARYAQEIPWPPVRGEQRGWSLSMSQRSSLLPRLRLSELRAAS